MAAEGPSASQRTLFVGLSTMEFNSKVRDLAELYCSIVDTVPPTGTPGGPLLREPGIRPHDAVIVAFSPVHGGQLPLAKTIGEVVDAFPNSQYYFVFPDDQPEDPLEPFIDKVLDGRAPGRAVVSLRNFAAALEQNVVEPSSSAGIASVHASFVDGDVANDELVVIFDQALSAAQIKDTLTALAAYYRACGGVGLPAEFESQEAAVLEDARVYEKGLLTRLRVKLTPQFVEDWLGAAGRRFRKTGQQLSEYNKDHAKLAEKVDEAPGLLWKAAQGAANTQLAKAEADYAKAENDRIDAELKRRTMTAKARHEEADADKAEAEAGTAKIREIQARIELYKQLKDIGVSATLNASMNLAVAPAPPTPPLIASGLLVQEEIDQIQGNLVGVACPDMIFGQDTTEITFSKWIASVGSRVETDEPIYEVSTPTVDSEIPSPASGTIVEVFVADGSTIVKGQLLGTILTTEAIARKVEPISPLIAEFLAS